MRIGIIVNRLSELTATQTTTLLGMAAAHRGHDVFIAAVEDLSWTEAHGPEATARRAPTTRHSRRWLLSLGAAPTETVGLQTLDAIVMRTNPARDERGWAQNTALSLVREARDRGVLVLNDPDGLCRAESKLYTQLLPPGMRPRTLVSCDRQAISEFLHAQKGPAVLKPLRGTRGRGVFKVQAGRAAEALVDLLLEEGHVIVQSYIPEAPEGDTRLILMDGRPLSVGGQIAAVRRIPAPGEFRSNVHIGGRPAPAEVTDRMLAVAEAIGPRLRADGIFLAGLDLVGDAAVEINVFSPGGLWDANRFYRQDYPSAVLAAIEEMIRLAEAA